MTLATILAFAAILSFLALRNTFFGLKLMAGMSWFVLWMFLKDNPPDIIAEGSGIHTALLIVIIGFGLMVVLSGLGRGIEQTKDRSGAFSVKTEGGFKFSIPDWMKNQNSPEAVRQRREQNLGEYRDKIHAALHPPKRRR